MAYKPKSKRTNSPVGPQGKKVLDGLTANKNIDDIRALSKISNTQSTSISTLNTGLSAANKGISQLSTSKQNKLTLTTNGTSGPATLNNNTLNVPNYSTGLTVGSTPIAGGAVGRILFEGTGNVLQESANLFWDQTNSRLGIGVTTPAQKLSILGNNLIMFTGVSAQNVASYVGTDINDNFFAYSAGQGLGKGGFYGPSNGTHMRTLANFLDLYTGNGSPVLGLRIVNATNNVLINTTTDAGYRFDVNGTARIKGLTTISDDNNLNFLTSVSPSSFVGVGFVTSGGTERGTFKINWGTGELRIGATGGGGYFPTFYSNGNEVMRIPTTGNILVNTTTDAGYKLDVNGTSRFSGITDFNQRVILNGNNLYLGVNNGNTVLRTLSNNIQLYNNNAGGILYLDANGSVQIGQTNAINWATFSASGHTIFGSTNTNFFSSGNIGVNTATDAGYKLDVNGTFKVSGAIYDSTNSPGTSGQVLSSTVTGTAWVAAGGGGGTIYKLTAQTLTAVSWTLVSGYYQYTFSNVNITTNTRVDFTPDNASYTEVTTCGMLTEVDVASGSCTFYSLFPPQSNITGEITIFPTV